MLKNWIRRKLVTFLNESFTPTFIWDYRGIKRLRVSNTVSFNHPEGVKFMGEGYIGHYTHLDGTGGLEIGEGVQMGECISIFTHSSHVSIRIYGRQHLDYSKRNDNMELFFKIPCKIGKFTFIGSQVMILPGAKSIGMGCFIHPGAIIKKSIPDFSEVDNTGTVIGDTRESDKKYLARNLTYQELYSDWVTK